MINCLLKVTRYKILLSYTNNLYAIICFQVFNYNTNNSYTIIGFQEFLSNPIYQPLRSGRI